MAPGIILPSTCRRFWDQGGAQGARFNHHHITGAGTHDFDQSVGLGSSAYRTEVAIKGTNGYRNASRNAQFARPLRAHVASDGINGVRFIIEAFA